MRRSFPVVLALVLLNHGPATVGRTEELIPPAAVDRSAPSSRSHGASSAHGVVVTGTSRSNRTAVYNAAQDLGVGWVRLTAYWDVLQPKGPTFDAVALADLKEQVRDARAAGLEVFMTLENSPAWARSQRGDHRYPPEAGYWRDYLRMLAGQFAGEQQVAAWGIWNEPNGTSFFEIHYTASDPAARERERIEAYKRLLESSDELRVNGSLVVAPNVDQTTAVEWIGSLLASHSDRFDVISLHQYNLADCTERDIRRVNRLVDLHSGATARARKPIWLTEAGFNGDSEGEQTRAVAGYLDEMVDGVAVDGCDWHPAYGETRGDAVWEKTFIYHLYASGLQQTHLVELDASAPRGYRPREAFRCFQQFTGADPRGLPNCTRR